MNIVRFLFFVFYGFLWFELGVLAGGGRVGGFVSGCAACLERWGLRSAVEVFAGALDLNSEL